jgi:CRISPR-associated protein Csm3
MKQLVKKIRIETTIELLTGLHIGGSKENVEIGGIDNPVIKLASKDGQPYIPGSSIKGKMRCLLEQAHGSVNVGDNEVINNLFGFAPNKAGDERDSIPSKVIVRDAMLTDESAKALRECDSLDMPYTENKFENVIDRVRGVAEHPRQSERVPAGAKFNLEMVVNVWDDDNEQELMTLLNKAMNMLENDYLGGSGSRGYGQIKFGDIKKTELSDANNWKA